MQTAEAQRTFERTGILRLPDAFTRDQAAAMVDTVWRFIERKTEFRRNDPATWSERLGLSFKSLKRNPVFAPLVDNAAVLHALDVVFGPGGAEAPKPGAQVLLTFPSPPPWQLPHRSWHMDCGFDRPTWPTFAVKLFACIGEVRPEGGATLALAGSHRLVERYASTLAPTEHGGNQVAWGRFMKQDPWLHEINKPGPEPERTRRLLGTTHEVDGVPIQVVEMAGQPGDVYITHMHVFHSGAPNVNDQPRLMVGKGIGAGGE
ncbi:MAG: phytanoyl-CoA dioxygenase family protein [Acidimicrobiia bacterium]